MRIIDADALSEHKFPTPLTESYQQGWNDAIDAIVDNALTVERPQGELAKEVWKLYEKHQSHLATYVIEFGDELKELLGKYQKGGAE